MSFAADLQAPSIGRRPEVCPLLDKAPASEFPILDDRHPLLRRPGEYFALPSWPVQAAILGANPHESVDLSGARAVAINRFGPYSTWLVLSAQAAYTALEDGAGHAVVLTISARGPRGSIPAHFKTVGQTRYLVVLSRDGARSIVVNPPRGDAIKLTSRVLDLLEHLVPRAGQSEKRTGSSSATVSAV